MSSNEVKELSQKKLKKKTVLPETKVIFKFNQTLKKLCLFTLFRIPKEAPFSPVPASSPSAQAALCPKTRFWNQ